MFGKLECDEEKLCQALLPLVGEERGGVLKAIESSLTWRGGRASILRQ